MQLCWHEDPKMRPQFAEIAESLKDLLEQANYKERSKTQDIKDDYYLEFSSMDDMNELYVQVIG